MFGILNFTTFILAGILLNLTPGTDTVYVLSKSIANGKKAGYFSALGISTGSVVHTILAAVGLSIILAKSQFAFNTVKYLGATYLIYLGIKAILSKTKNNMVIEGNQKKQKNSIVYISGILTNVLNPKVALFYLSFLPQFIDPTYKNYFMSFLILGLTFTVTGTIWCLILAAFSSIFSEKILKKPKIKSWLDKLTGLVFISLGLKLAFSKLK